jgi:hypothetical protein
MDPQDKVDIDQLKLERLLDILRHVIANPENAPKVAEALARDWFPRLRVGPNGKFDFAE